MRSGNGESMHGVCYQLHGDNRRVTHTQEHWRASLASHQQAAHGGEDDMKCPACSELKERAVRQASAQWKRDQRKS
jgi:hypothetical protein